MTDYKQEIEEILLTYGGYCSQQVEATDGDRQYYIATTALTHLINKAKVEELKRLKAIDAFNEAYTLDPRPAKLVDMRIKELQEGREG